jgi:hypothetical protein
MPTPRKGLYANIHARRKAGKKPRKPGSAGAPSAADFKAAAKTAKKPKSKRKTTPRRR